MTSRICMESYEFQRGWVAPLISLCCSLQTLPFSWVNSIPYLKLCWEDVSWFWHLQHTEVSTAISGFRRVSGSESSHDLLATHFLVKFLKIWSRILQSPQFCIFYVCKTNTIYAWCQQCLTAQGASAPSEPWLYLLLCIAH